MSSISKQFSSMMAATFLLFCLLGSPPVASHVDCVPHERAALLEFRRGISLNDSPPGSLNSWEGLNCCAWQGIECSQSTGNVIKLDLHKQWLGGNISSSLAKLQFLEHLDLGWNVFTGVISPQIGTLTRLQHLDLSYCGWNLESRSIAWVGNLSKLTYLSLDGVNLSRCAFPTWRFPNSISPLQHLSLFECSVAGAIPSFLYNLTSLAYLDLGYNGLSSPSVSRLLSVAAQYFPRLTSLYLYDTGIQGKIPSTLGNITSLTHLVLSFNRIEGVIPASLANLSTLHVLDLSYNKLSGDIPTVLANLRSLSSLYLECNGLTGSIPPSIGNLRGLSSLHLEQNRLSGSIPPCIGNLRSLSSLHLELNGLTGSIPPSIGNLRSLSSLHLGWNGLSGSIPPSIGNLPLLTEMDLNGNTLSGSIPHSFNNLSSLRSLFLQNNQLNGSIPSFFAFPAALVTIDLSGNSLAGAISLSLFQHLPRLEVLGLSRNRFTVNATLLSVPAFQLQALGLAGCNIVGEFPTFISTQYRLEHLDLSNNRLVGNIPSWLWDLPGLNSLNLSYNVFQGRLPLTLNSPSLESLDLKNNSLDGPLPQLPQRVFLLDLSENQFSGFIAPEMFKYTLFLEFLSFSKNKLSGAIPFQICNGGEYGVKVVDLSDNRLSSIAPPGLQNCSSLSVLNLRNNNLKYKDIAKRLGTLPSLTTLLLNNNRLSGFFPVCVRKYTTLKMIDLSGNSLRGGIPRWIGDLKELRVLLLKWNKLSGQIPWEITSLHNLQIVDLSFNNLQGEIPNNLTDLHAMIRPLTDIHSLEHTYFSNFSIAIDAYSWKHHLGDDEHKYGDEADLTNKGQRLHYLEEILSILASIDLSHNNLSGKIPTEIGILKGLRNFNISRNAIDGQIPEMLKNLSELESLDLSHNKLEGIIPSALQSVTSLEVFDVSYNNLSGRIPTENQFLGFNAWMFEGNKYLCGIQVNRRCGDGTDGWSPRPEKQIDNVKREGERGKKLEIPWWHVGVGVGFGFGFSCVCLVLGVNSRWRSAYFRVMDRIVIAMLERLGIM